MAVLLGKTATVSCGGVSAGSRSVTVEETADELEFQPFGLRDKYVYTTGYSATAQIEFIDDGAAGLISSLQLGSEVVVSISPGSWSFTGNVTAISQAMPLDGVASWTVTVKKTYPGLR